MIELWPAIDIIKGQSVRLTEGDYQTEQRMPRSLIEAITFYQQFEAVKRIHMVDLLGALEKGPKEMETFVDLVKHAKLPIEVGGGIRSQETIDSYLNLGVDYLIIGTRGLQDPEWLIQMAEYYPNKLYLGLDAVGTEIAVNGWQESLQQSIFDFAKQLDNVPIGGIIYTDIRKDGRMSGPSFELTGQLAQATNHPVIASGGIRNKADIDQLESLGIHAAIVGKAANTDAFWEDFK